MWDTGKPPRLTISPGPAYPTLPDAQRSGRLFAAHGVIIGLCLVIGAALSFMRGQDTNFDQLNYHYYIAYSDVTDRLALDVAPAQVDHSFFSPVAYLPFYLMVRHLPPSVVGMALGALHGLNVWLVFVIGWIVTRSLATPVRIIATIAAVAISVASPMAMSELGTTMVDLLVSLPVLAGVAFLLHAGFDTRAVARAAASMALAGAFLGAATSLKLTSAAFALGLAAASPIGWQGWRQRLTAVLATGIGGIVGFALVGGFWYLRMWRMFGNPVFPYFNTLFRSPDYPVTSLFDGRFYPHGIAQALIYPFLWMKAQTTTAELPFRDIRFAMLYVLILGVLLLRLLLARRVPDESTPADRRLIVFFVVAFSLWLYEWSIQRYLVSLELLTGPAILSLLRWSGLLTRLNAGAMAILALVICGVCFATMQAPDWGHIRWAKTWYAIDVPPAAANAPVFFLDDAPLSYVVPSLPKDAAVIDVARWEDMQSWGDTVFLKRINAILADRRNQPIWAVSSSPELSDVFVDRMGHYGLRVEGNCQKTVGRPLPLTWCLLARVPAGG